jgi:pimeloyl-ACP methyl ester carboxylesterase
MSDGAGAAVRHGGRVQSRDGVAVHWRSLGRGPALLLLHGLQRRSSVWDPLAERLAGRHRVLLPDLRGRAPSDCPTRAEAYALARYADDLAAVLDTLDEPVDLVAWSFGATVALACAQRAQAVRVRRWVLVSALLDQGDARRLLPGPTRADAERQARERAAARGIADPADAHGVSCTWQQLADATDWPRHPPAGPLLLVHGDRDDECSPAAARDRAASWPGCGLCWLPGVGHNPLHECPDRLCDAVLDFLPAGMEAA